MREGAFVRCLVFGPTSPITFAEALEIKGFVG